MRTSTNPSVSLNRQLTGSQLFSAKYQINLLQQGTHKSYTGTHVDNETILNGISDEYGNDCEIRDGILWTNPTFDKEEDNLAGQINIRVFDSTKGPQITSFNTTG